MTRHSRNCTAHSVYTYHEKRRDAKTGNYGTTRLRLAKESSRQFDCCALTLQPSPDLLVSPQGYLFDRAAILEYILIQKQLVKKRIRDWEDAERKRKQIEREHAAKSAHEKRKQEFLRANEFRSEASTSNISQKNEAENVATSSSLDKKCFWVAESHDPESTRKFATSSKTSSSSEPTTSTLSSSSNQLTKVTETDASATERPDDKVRCPISGAPLLFKQLIPVQFTRTVEADSVAKETGEKCALHMDGDRRYKCALTGDVLSNVTPLVVLRHSGHVVTEEAVNRLIRAPPSKASLSSLTANLNSDMRCPFTNRLLAERDLIRLQRGASSFASSGHNLIATTFNPMSQT